MNTPLRAGLAALVSFNVMAAVALDREVSAEDIFQVQEDSIGLYGGGPDWRVRRQSRYQEDYTSAWFVDFHRRGELHPLLEEHSAELVACGVSPEVDLSFKLVVSTDAGIERLELDADGADRGCLRAAFRRMPFDTLAPPTGRLVLTGMVTGADLAGEQAISSRERGLDPTHHEVFYWGASDPSSDAKLPMKNGRPRAEDARLSQPQLEAINAMLTCPSELPLTHVEFITSYQEPSSWLDEQLGLVGKSQRLLTSPRVPCVEQRLRERWREIPALFGQEKEVPVFSLSFTVLLQPLEGE